MNARIVDMEGSVHQRVQKLLPWLLSGQLVETEEKLVQEHIGSCQECSDDLAWQRKLRAVQPAAGATPDMEAALARLTPQLAPREQAANGSWTRWALAAQLLIILGLGGKLLASQAPEYRLLGAATPAAANMIVMFRPGATEAQLRTVFKSNFATVVGGPTSTSAWLVSVPPAGLDDAVANMRADPAVAMAEPLQAAR